MNILTKYYEGINLQIQAEVNFINEIFFHNGVKGEGNEKIIFELLNKFIPKKYGIGSGIIIDRHGNQSKQCDIVIYDNYNYPEILSISNIHLYPVDIVYAAIEVKSYLDSTTAKLAIDNISSIKNLDYLKHNFRIDTHDPIEEITDDTIIFTTTSTTAPLGIVFAYHSATSYFETFASWFKKDIEPCYPSHIFCMDQGFLLTQSLNGFHPFLSPLVENDCYTLVKKDEKTVKKNNKDWFEKDGIYYPVSKFKKDKLIVDQSKVLINFIFILFELLKRKNLSPLIDFRKEYFSEELLTMFSIENDKIAVFKH